MTCIQGCHLKGGGGGGGDFPRGTMKVAPGYFQRETEET